MVPGAPINDDDEAQIHTTRTTVDGKSVALYTNTHSVHDWHEDGRRHRLLSNFHSSRERAHTHTSICVYVAALPYCSRACMFRASYASICAPFAHVCIEQYMLQCIYVGAHTHTHISKERQESIDRICVCLCVCMFSAAHIPPTSYANVPKRLCVCVCVCSCSCFSSFVIAGG